MKLWPFRRRSSEVRQLQWPFDVGPPVYSLGVSTVEEALSLIPVYASARLLADAVASLPLQTYRDVGEHAVKLPTAPLFQQPAAVGTLYDWLFAMMSSLVLKGNAYGLVTQRDGFQFPTSIEWLDPEKVWVDERVKTGSYYLDGRELVREDVFHVRGFTVPGCVKGISPIKAFASTISAGMAMTQYSADWFSNGGFPPGTFKNSAQTVQNEDADRIKARLVAAIRARQPLVYGSDWDYNAVAVPPEEAQFVLASQMNATQIAAIYGIPPERVGGARAGGSSLTYANQEQDEIAFQSSAVRPWVVRLEHAFFGLLPEKRYVRFNLDAALRTDLKTRHEVYEIDRVIGLRNIDELRALEELPALPGGEGKDYAPLSKAAAKAPPTGPGPTPDIVPARPRAVS